MILKHSYTLLTTFAVNYDVPRDANDYDITRNIFGLIISVTWCLDIAYIRRWGKITGTLI